MHLTTNMGLNCSIVSNCMSWCHLMRALCNRCLLGALVILLCKTESHASMLVKSRLKCSVVYRSQTVAKVSVQVTSTVPGIKSQRPRLGVGYNMSTIVVLLVVNLMMMVARLHLEHEMTSLDKGILRIEYAAVAVESSTELVPS